MADIDVVFGLTREEAEIGFDVDKLFSELKEVYTNGVTSNRVHINKDINDRRFPEGFVSDKCVVIRLNDIEQRQISRDISQLKDSLDDANWRIVNNKTEW